MTKITFTLAYIVLFPLIGVALSKHKVANLYVVALVLLVAVFIGNAVYAEIIERGMK